MKDLNRPLYSPGETVILCAPKPFDKFNGEQIIGTVLFAGEMYFDRIHHCDVRFQPSNQRDMCYYIMEDVLIWGVLVGENEPTAEGIIPESWLKRKYTPSEFSFEELMKNINNYKSIMGDV